MDQLIESLSNTIFRKGPFDHDVASRWKATEEDFGWRGYKRREDLRDVGWSAIDQLERFCFQHEAEKFLIGFSFKNDGFPIEAFSAQDFIWWKIFGAGITKDESIVNVANVFDKQIMIGQHLFEIDGPNLFTDGDNHQT